MAPAPKYKVYHGSTYIGSFKYSDDAETYCEAMQKAGKIIGELTIRNGHTKASIELTYKADRDMPTLKVDKAVVVDEPDHTAYDIAAVEVGPKVNTSKLALDDGGTLQWANIVINQGEIESVNIAGKEYGISINDIGDEPSDVPDYVPEVQSCIAITSSHGQWIVKSITGTVREWQGDGGEEHEPEDYANITRFDLTEYREWRGMRPAELPQGGAIDVLLVGYWYTRGLSFFYEQPSASARDSLLEELRTVPENLTP